ncbi:glycosyltransferase [Dactylosporangium cerinum]
MYSLSVYSLSVYSLIVPVYRNEGSIPDLLAAVEDLYDALDHRLEAVVVVDGSPDGSAELLQALLPRQRYPATLVLLSRNFGSFAAIRVGLQHATGEYFAVMAADLQEPPELALEFFRTLAADEHDVVVGTREGRADPLGSRLAAGVFWGCTGGSWCRTCRRAASTSSAATARSATACWSARRPTRPWSRCCSGSGSAASRSPTPAGPGSTAGPAGRCARRSRTSWTASSRSPTCRCGC